MLNVALPNALPQAYPLWIATKSDFNKDDTAEGKIILVLSLRSFPKNWPHTHTHTVAWFITATFSMFRNLIHNQEKALPLAPAERGSYAQSSRHSLLVGSGLCLPGREKHAKFSLRSLSAEARLGSERSSSGGELKS